MSHPINDKVIGEAGEKWVVGATFQADFSFQLSSEVKPEELKSLMTWKNQ